MTGPWVAAWMDDGRRHGAERRLRTERNPLIDPDPDDDTSAFWTWVIDAPGARSAILWTNAVFDHREPERSELARLPGSDLWAICLRLPAALRVSYRVAVWNDDAAPPWRCPTDRREIVLAALGAGARDPRGAETIRLGAGEEFSVGAGPDAPREPWRTAPGGDARSRLTEIALAGAERAWVYTPSGADERTPLVVLFDGQAWREAGLPDALDAAIAGGFIRPLHVALLDSHDQSTRWERLGVPGGQVDTVIDELLPRIRRGWNVDPTGEATVVAGQSLGGIAALWTLALSGGEVAHAIAQSPSLWRFDVADALLDEPGWLSIDLQAGTFEPDMLNDARELGAALADPARLGGRTVRMTALEAGHDWAAWRTHLLLALARVFPG